MFSSSSCVLHWIEQWRNDRLLARIQETFPAGSGEAISKDQLRMITQGLRTSSREFAAAEIVDQMQAHYNVSYTDSSAHESTDVYVYFL